MVSRSLSVVMGSGRVGATNALLVGKVGGPDDRADGGAMEVVDVNLAVWGISPRSSALAGSTSSAHFVVSIRRAEIRGKIRATPFIGEHR